MKHTIILLFILLLSLSAMYCSNERALPSGFETLQRENKGAIFTYHAPLVQTASFRVPVLAGSVPYLVLGEYDGKQSYIALKFGTLSIIDTATVRSATLIMRRIATYGSDGSFNGTIHPINITWTENRVEWDSLKYGYSSVNVVPFTLTPSDSGLLKASLDTSMVNDWKRGRGNDGILLMFEQATSMLKFYSSEALTGVATMQVIYSPKAGGLDTVTVSADQDASLIQPLNAPQPYTLENEPDRLLLDNAIGNRFFLRFHIDPDSLPKTATIHRALLTFNIDRNNSATDSAGIALIVRQVVTDSAWQNLTTMKLDTIYSSPQATAMGNGDILQISQTPYVSYMGGMVQRLVLRQQQNYGIVVQSLEYGHDPEKVAFENIRNKNAPSLEIIYSKPPSPQF